MTSQNVLWPTTTPLEDPNLEKSNLLEPPQLQWKTPTYKKLIK